MHASKSLYVTGQEETKTPLSLRSAKKEVTELAKEVATPVVEALKKRVSRICGHTWDTRTVSCSAACTSAINRSAVHVTCCTWVSRSLCCFICSSAAGGFCHCCVPMLNQHACCHSACIVWSLTSCACVFPCDRARAGRPRRPARPRRPPRPRRRPCRQARGAPGRVRRPPSEATQRMQGARPRACRAYSAALAATSGALWRAWRDRWSKVVWPTPEATVYCIVLTLRALSCAVRHPCNAADHEQRCIRPDIIIHTDRPRACIGRSVDMRTGLRPGHALS